MRTFIAVHVEPGPDVNDVLRAMNDIKGMGVKPVEPANVHITLKFLGEVDEERVDEISEALENASRGLDPFTMGLRGMGVFPSENYIKVVWIGIACDELKELASRVDRGLANIGFKAEKKKFSPHLTLARVKSGQPAERIRSVLDEYRKNDFGEQKVGAFYFMKSTLTSEGPIYDTIREFLL